MNTPITAKEQEGNHPSNNGSAKWGEPAAPLPELEQLVEKYKSIYLGLGATLEQAGEKAMDKAIVVHQQLQEK